MTTKRKPMLDLTWIPMAVRLLTAASLFGVCIVLYSCVGNDAYRVDDLEQNALKNKTQWRQKSEAFEASDLSKTSWWEGFGDPQLTRLIREAVEGNIDLRIAGLRLENAGISVRESGAGRWPNATLSGNYSWSRSQSELEVAEEVEDADSEEGVFEEIEYESEIRSNEYEYMNLGINLSWELDIWGRKKKGVLASRSAYREKEANYRAARLKLMAEVAAAYFELRQKDQEIRIVTEQLADQVQRLDIYERQYREGIVPEWKVLRQRSEVKMARVELSQIEGERRRLENRIATLLGRPAGTRQIPVKHSLDVLSIPKIPSGLPADLLSRRPDIIAARHRAEAAFHRVGEARAARLPTIQLTANGGLASNALSSFLDQWTLGLAPSLMMPLFDAGARKARVERNVVQQKIAEQEYGRVVLQSFEEVENLLTRIHTESRRYRATEQKSRLMDRIRRQTAAKFEMGLLSQLELMDIDRERYASKRSMARMKRNLLDGMTSLWKAMGGGWTSHEKSAGTFASGEH